MAVQDDVLHQFAQSLIDRRFGDARKVLAPWLQRELDESALESALDEVIATGAEQAGIEEPRWPTEFSIGHNEIDLAELRSDEPSEIGRLSDSITDNNYRGWHVMTFNPDSDDNVTFGVWAATVVDDTGDLRLGHVAFLAGD